MLLLLQLISLCSLAFGQFYNAHPLMANDGMAGLYQPQYNPGSGDSETLPISQDELAQLMAQSLASSSGHYGHQPPARYQHQHQGENAQNDELGAANYDGGDDGGSEGASDGGNDGAIAHNNPEEYAHDGGGGGQYGQQGAGEASPYQQHGGQQEDSQYQQPEEPQQTYRDNNGYQNAPPNHQQEGDQYQSGQYPESPSSSYGPQSSQGSHQESGPYDGHSGSQYGSNSNSNGYSPRGPSYSQNPYNPQNAYRSNSPRNQYHGSQAGPRYPNSHDSDSSYSSPGSGYSGHGSDSLLSYDINHSPTNKYYRN